MVGDFCAPKRVCGAVVAVIAAVGVLLSVGCAAGPTAGRVSSTASAAEPDPVVSASEPVVSGPSQAPAGTVPTAAAEVLREGEQESAAAPRIPGSTGAQLSPARKAAIEQALRGFLAKTAGAQLVSFRVVADSPASSAVGASVSYRGSIVELSVALTTKAGKPVVLGAYRIGGTS